MRSERIPRDARRICHGIRTVDDLARDALDLGVAALVVAAPQLGGAAVVALGGLGHARQGLQEGGVALVGEGGGVRREPEGFHALGHDAGRLFRHGAPAPVARRRRRDGGRAHRGLRRDSGGGVGGVRARLRRVANACSQVPRRGHGDQRCRREGHSSSGLRPFADAPQPEARAIGPRLHEAFLGAAPTPAAHRNVCDPDWTRARITTSLTHANQPPWSLGLCKITWSKLQNYQVNYQFLAYVFLHVKKYTKIYMTSQRQMSDVARYNISKMSFLPELRQVELGFSCLASRASLLWRPKKHHVHPFGGVPIFFDRIDNRTENTQTKCCGRVPRP